MAVANISELEFLAHNNRKAILYVPVSIYIGMTMIIGIIGNSLVCYIYGRMVKHTPTNCFILSLGIYDLICCGVTLPLEIVEMRYPYYYIETCKFQRLHITATAIASGFILLAIAVDRYIRVCKPHKSKIESQVAVKISILSGTLALALSIPVVLIYGQHTYMVADYDILVSECSSTSESGRSVFPQAYYAFLFILFVVILIPLAVLYGLIWRTLHQRKKTFSFSMTYLSASRNSFHNITSNEVPLMLKQSKGKSKSDPTVNNIKGDPLHIRKSTIDKKNRYQFYKLKRTTFKLFLTTAFFTISFLPYHALMIYRTVVGDLVNLKPGAELTYNLFLRSYQLYTLNPTIYAICDNKFWTQLSILFPFCHCRRKDEKEDSEEVDN